MKRIEAIALPAACVPLANRLAAQGINIELTNADLVALAGLNRVFNYDEGWWLDEPSICYAAGLSPSDIGALNFIAANASW